MKSIIVVLCLFAVPAIAGTCADDAASVAPVLSAAARQTYAEHLEAARKVAARNPESADALVWLGRRAAYPGGYTEAIRIFTDGARRFPADARFLRHRGHRLITLRCFDDAIADLEAAARLVKGKPDEIEPDGLPNARNTPTSTLKTNIFYHLGLAHYLKGDFRKALRAYDQCVKYSTNPDMLVAAKHWQYMTLRRLGRARAASKAVSAIPDGLDIIENGDYYRLVKLYQGKISADEIEKAVGDNAAGLSSASLGYGLGNWYLYIGETEKGLRVFSMITAGDQWASFGYIAAETELKRAGVQK